MFYFQQLEFQIKEQFLISFEICFLKRLIQTPQLFTEQELQSRDALSKGPLSQENLQLSIS